MPAAAAIGQLTAALRQALDVPFSLLADEAAPPRPGPDAATLKNLTLLNRMQGNPQVSHPPAGLHVSSSFAKII